MSHFKSIVRIIVATLQEIFDEAASAIYVANLMKIC